MRRACSPGRWADRSSTSAAQDAAIDVWQEVSHDSMTPYSAQLTEQDEVVDGQLEDVDVVATVPVVNVEPQIQLVARITALSTNRSTARAETVMVNRSIRLVGIWNGGREITPNLEGSVRRVHDVASVGLESWLRGR
ncbi:hypothetical protein PFICI_10690 [Pestalotiopsis fici W106-1]|uniref:Uncharacterized protein n=1 Tax=Pestalotiopsis fici (strain W106-1 / CGMCC3.15140) TaxID=1229662 RepID=W3WXN9_PESFW|nr:uncharacterized protein PFICI_10690 [Pestalotiopsis fici W106-1]ETS78628.1 hypothetical protein PFICI_10690 [Pestalotiopsis fici W106-1]